MKNIRTFLALPAALLCFGCNELGDVGPENLGHTASGQVVQSTPPDPQPFTAPIEDFLGEWVGVAEDPLALGVDPDGTAPAYRFPSGSTRISLSLSFDFELAQTNFSYLEGKLQFGAGQPPEPVTDPDQGYPAGVSYSQLLSYFPDSSSAVMNDDGLLPPHEGFDYPVYRSFGGGETVPDIAGDVAIADGLLKLDYHTTEVLRQWCHLQTSYPDDRGGYRCIPGIVSQLPDASCVLSSYVEPDECTDAQTCRAVGDLGPVDCNKAFLCKMEHCDCYETGCAINGGEAAELRSRAQLSLRRVGDDLIGVVTNAIFLNERGARTPLGRIRFQRAN